MSDLATSSFVREPRVAEVLRDILPDDTENLDEEVAASSLNHVIRVLVDHNMEDILAKLGIPFPRYPATAATSGGTAPPEWDRTSASLVGPDWSLLGRKVGFPIGVPSSELTSTPDWIEYYARRGFHILTYRTVRSKERVGTPDWPFLEGIDRPWEPDRLPSSVRATLRSSPPDWRGVSTATPFDAPSPHPNIWQEQVAETLRRLSRLREGHLLILSVMDSVPAQDKTRDAIVADFVKVAQLADATGVPVIECHLARSSMPGATGQVCCDHPDVAIEVVREVRRSLKTKTKLLVKLGYMHREKLEAVVVPLAADGLIDGVSGISPARVEARREDGTPLSEMRLPGVAGLAIRNLGLNFVEALETIRRENNVHFDIVAMGGVMGPNDVSSYMERGADAVQSASAARLDPELAVAASRAAMDRPVGLLHRIDRPNREQILERLDESLTMAQQVIWLTSSNSVLGGERPLDYLEAGGTVEAVASALDNFDAGGFD
ncbi:MAG: DUF2384 domain-containing protein [Actinobacteria bacterium]|nr:DUF2384 domain-containing protein [Actinomycetota bacterium]